MTREENLHWIDQEIQTWENECQSKHPIKEALYAARKALEQEPTTKNNRGVDCSLDDFIKYCKRTFGVELTVKKSDNPDTYDKLFGTTKNNLDADAVSRKDVHDMLENLPITVEDKWFNWLQKACMRLAELPPVTPQEPKTGEWCKQNDDYFDWYECSECGYGSEGEMQYSSEYDVRTNFCPNCGAKMQEVEE